MAQVPFPAPGTNGDEPPMPGAPARDGQPVDAGPVRDGQPGDTAAARDGISTDTAGQDGQQENVAAMRHSHPRDAGQDGRRADDPADDAPVPTGDAPAPAVPTGEAPAPAVPTGDAPAPAVPTGDAPAPAVPTGDAPAPAASADAVASGGDDGFDAAADMAQMLEDIEAGLIEIPPEGELVPPVMFALGETADIDPAELAAMAGPDGIGGHTFTQHQAADAMRPGPLLSVLTEQAAADPAALGDDALLGMVSAARRLSNRARFLELSGIAEFGRRRAAQYAASVTAKARPGRRDGEFADDELGFELVLSRHAAGDRMELAASLAARLPCTRAALAAGLIDDDRAAVIWSYTRFLSDADAAYADQVLAAAAPGLRYEQLSGKAYRLEIKLDPAGVEQRRAEARRKGRRVETRREQSGNMAFGGRELTVAEALAAKAVNDADALALRAAGMPGTLQDLRVLALLDRARGLNPLNRLTNPDGNSSCDEQGEGQDGHDEDRDDDDEARDGHGDEGQDGHDEDRDDDGEGRDGYGGGEDRDDDGEAGYGGEDDPEDPEDGGSGGGGSGGGGSGGGGPAGGTGGTGAAAPFPALINLVVPAGTLFGWSSAAGEAGNWGLLDPAGTRGLVAAASEHRRTRWCVTVTGTDGTAAAHGCGRGQHPWIPPGRDGPARDGASDTGPRRDRAGPPGLAGSPPPGETEPPGKAEPPGEAEPGHYQRTQLAGLLRTLNLTLTPVVRGACDHSQREERYGPSRALRHLVRARTARCAAPGCGAHAGDCDVDHTRAYPGGPTCPCNLAPACRHHHRTKQAPGWHLDQPEPGRMRWTTPSGRVYTTTPTVYDT